MTPRFANLEAPIFSITPLRDGASPFPCSRRGSVLHVVRRRHEARRWPRGMVLAWFLMILGEIAQTMPIRRCCNTRTWWCLDVEEGSIALRFLTPHVIQLKGLLHPERTTCSCKFFFQYVLGRIRNCNFKRLWYLNSPYFHRVFSILSTKNWSFTTWSTDEKEIRNHGNSCNRRCGCLAHQIRSRFSI